MNMKKLCGTLWSVTALLAAGTPAAAASGDLEGLEKTAGYQQKAIYYFIQAMKNVKKRIDTNAAGQNAPVIKEKNPFADRQDFKAPEIPPEKNPQVRLQKIIDRQNELMEELKKTGEPAKTAPKQEAVGNAVAQLKADAELDAAVKQALERAMQSSYDAARLMKTANPEFAGVKAQKVLSDLKDAMRRLETASDDKFKRTLTDAQKKVNNMAGKGENEKTEQKLKALRDEMTAAARQQHQGGKQKNAENLAALAKEINARLQAREKQAKQGFAGEGKTAESGGGKGGKDGESGKGGKDGESGKGGEGGKDGKGGTGDGKSLSEALRELQKLIAGLRLQNRKDLQIFADSIKELQAYEQELRFLAKHPDSMTADRKKELLEDIEMKIADMTAALESLASGSPAKLLSDLQQAGGNLQGQIGRLKELPGKQNAPGFVYDPLVYPEKIRGLDDSLHKILVNAALLLNNLKTEELIYIFNPNDVPERYRDDVADYFERLSNPGKNGNKNSKK